MLHRLRVCGPWLVGFVLAFFALAAFAQVPQETTFTGRLVDDLGAPLVGPVILELRVFDAESLGTELYSEQHLGTALDATGGFSVQLGRGTSPSGTFDAGLFSDVGRWLEVVVGTDVLTPRQVIGSVPWALVAQQANKVVPDPTAPRFEDCGDGTVADHQTGLQWEQKTGTVGAEVICESGGCPDPHDVNNRYWWSDFGAGTVNTLFLPRLNGDYAPNAATGCFADHCDWALPKISELQTILIGPEAAPGQLATCSASPCIEPDFAAIGGPTASSFYWSGTAGVFDPGSPWYAGFNDGLVDDLPIDEALDSHARAVRTGSCH